MVSLGSGSGHAQRAPQPALSVRHLSHGIVGQLVYARAAGAAVLATVTTPSYLRTVSAECDTSRLEAQQGSLRSLISIRQRTACNPRDVRIVPYNKLINVGDPFTRIMLNTYLWL